MVETNITQIGNAIKQLPLEQKKVNIAEEHRLQQQTTALCAQQQQREEKVEELQAEAEKVIGIIQPVH